MRTYLERKKLFSFPIVRKAIVALLSSAQNNIRRHNSYFYVGMCNKKPFSLDLSSFIILNGLFLLWPLFLVAFGGRAIGGEGSREEEKLWHQSDFFGSVPPPAQKKYVGREMEGKFSSFLLFFRESTVGGGEDFGALLIF